MLLTQYVTAAYERVLLPKNIAVRMKLCMYPAIYKEYMNLNLHDFVLV